MNFFNIFLLIANVLYGLSIVNFSNHKREIFIELQYAKNQEKLLEDDFNYLQYQKCILLKISRLERIAFNKLKMKSIINFS